jgi:hypothetical protein
MVNTPGFIQNTGLEVQILMIYCDLCYLQLIQAITQGERNPFTSEVSFLTVPCVIQYICDIIRVFNLVPFEIMRISRKGGAEQVYFVCMLGIGYFGFLYLAFILEKIVATNTMLKLLIALQLFPVLQFVLTCFKAINKNVYLFNYQAIGWLFIALISYVSKGGGSFYFNLKPNQTLAVITVVGWTLVNLLMFNQSVQGLYFFLPKSWLQKYFARALQHNPQNPAGVIHARCKVCEINNQYDPEQNRVVPPVQLEAACGHTYHYPCLITALNRAYMCVDPNCRKTILPDSEGF